MQIEEVKWWQWIVISLMCGAALAALHLQPFDATDVTSMGMIRIERDINAGPVVAQGQKFAPITNIVVYPTLLNAKGSGLTQIKLYVLDLTKGEYDARVCNADAPYYPHLPTSPVAALANETAETLAERYYGVKTIPREVLQGMQDQNKTIENAPHAKLRAGMKYNMPPKWTPTVLEYFQEQVAEQAKANPTDGPWLKVQYAWWSVPRVIWTMWMGGSFLIVGVIWPATLQLLVKGGFGRAPDENLMDLSRFGKGGRGKAKVVPAAALTMTADEIEEMNALEAKILAELKEQQGSGAQPVAAMPEEIRQLDGQTAAPAAGVVEDQAVKMGKDFGGGVFYPVALPKLENDPKQSGSPSTESAAKKSDKPAQPK